MLRPIPALTLLLSALLPLAVHAQAERQADFEYAPQANATIAAMRAPDYPPNARLTCAHGRVKLQVRVDSRGFPHGITVQETSGNAEMDAAAVKAVKGWSFNPKVVDGSAVEDTVIVPVAFEDPCPPGTAVPPKDWDPVKSPQGWDAYEDVAGREKFPPRYPLPAAGKCVGGVVQVRVTIDAMGEVVKAAVDTSSGNADLDAAALEAAKFWSYRPGKHNGVTAGGDVLVPVHFKAPC